MGWDGISWAQKKFYKFHMFLFGVFDLYADPAAGIPNCPFTTERSTELLMVPSLLSLILILLHTTHHTSFVCKIN
jgi:hypothetical protein